MYVSPSRNKIKEILVPPPSFCVIVAPTLFSFFFFVIVKESVGGWGKLWSVDFNGQTDGKPKPWEKSYVYCTLYTIALGKLHKYVTAWEQLRGN
jgi:hypothetical protein